MLEGHSQPIEHSLGCPAQNCAHAHRRGPLESKGLICVIYILALHGVVRPAYGTILGLIVPLCHVL